MLFYDLTGVDEIVRGGKRPTWHKATDGRTDEEGGSARGKNRPTSDGEEERTCEGERERRRARSAFRRISELRGIRKSEVK